MTEKIFKLSYSDKATAVADLKAKGILVESTFQEETFLVYGEGVAAVVEIGLIMLEPPTFDEVQQKLNAEIVAGNLICGILDKRVFVGKTNEDGMFEITPEGKEMLEALNKEKPAKKAKEKAEEADK